MTGYLTTLAKLGEDATEGPWEIEQHAVPSSGVVCEIGSDTFVTVQGTCGSKTSDARFIAVSRNVWDEMVAALRAADEKHHGVQWEESPSGMTMEFHRDDNGASCLCGRLARDCTELIALTALKAKVESL